MQGSAFLVTCPSPMPRKLHSPPVLRRIYLAALLLGGLLFVSAALPASLRTLVGAYFPIFHGMLETMALVVAGSIFAIVWSTADEQLPLPLPILASGFTAIAILDFSHLILSEGMPGFGIAGSQTSSTLFGFASRPLSALLLMALLFIPWDKTLTHSRRQILLALGMAAALVACIAWLVLGHVSRFAVLGTLADAASPLRTGAETVFILLNLLAALLFLQRARQAASTPALLLCAASTTLAASGILFLLHRSTTDLSHLLAHAFKLAAWLFVFQAVCLAAVRRPYELLRNSRQRLDATLEALPDLVFEIDRNGNYLAVHAGQQGELSAPAAELVGRNVTELMPLSQSQRVLAAIDEAERHGISRGKLLKLNVVDGRTLWFELSVAPTAASNDDDQHFLVVSRDVTERETQRQRLQSLSMAVEQSPSAIIITDEHTCIQYVNEAFTLSSGYRLDEVLGLHPRFLHSPKNPHNLEDIIESRIRQGKHWRGEIVCLSKEGKEFTESVLLYAIHDEQGRISNFLAIKEDITSQIEAAESIRQLSHYDQLTGLPNRQLLSELFVPLQAAGDSIAALWIDLDHFKDINDALGHSMGDLLLQEVARRLRNTLRIQDVLCRVSGDDFIVLLPDGDQSLAASMSRWLIDAMLEPIRLGAHTVSVTASIGIALCPEDALQLEPLLQKAEIAMYRMKQAGRNDYSFFAAEMQDKAIRTLTLSNALKQALSRGEFHLVYQPQLCLADKRIIGAEVLLRWNYPPWGAISPAEFIPIAEAGGQIVAIGEWVLRSALTQLRQWLDQGYDITLAVNLSAIQFEHAGLTEMLNRLLHDCGVAAERLELELTEAVAMKTPSLAAQRMSELRRIGVGLAIDDFGTGYSSLSYLKRFKIHKLKIDQSFIRDLENDPDDRAIATAIIQMAHSLGMLTIAEGVETAEQLAWLTKEQCDQIQGYHLSRPLPGTAFEEFLNTHSTSPGN